MKFSHSTLDNGFNVITDHIPEAKAVSVHWVLRAGARHDRVSGTGHFFEHMLCNSLTTDTGGKVYDRFEKISSNRWFSTSPAAITGYADILPIYAPEIIRTLGKTITHPVWTPEIFEQQRELILNEHDEAEKLQVDVRRLLAAAFSGHPVGRHPLGERKNIEQMTQEHLFEYMQKHFLAGDMGLIVSGPLSHEEVLSLATEAFAGVLPGNNAAQEKPVGSYGQLDLTIWPKKDEQAIIFVSEGLPVSDPDFNASSYMMSMLGFELDTFLRDHGYSYQGLHCHAASGFSDFGQNYIAFFMDPHKAVLSATEAAQFIASPALWLTEEKFDFMQLRNKTHQAFECFNPSRRASSLASNFDDCGKATSYDALVEECMNVDFRAVQDAYRRFVSMPMSVFGNGPCESLPSPQEISTIIAGPKKPPEPEGFHI